MENNKLISHPEYEDLIDLPTVSDIEFRIKSRKYRNFLKQPLELWMFVPCDENGNVLEEPKRDKDTYTQDLGVLQDYDVIEVEEYNEAKDKVLFEGFEVCNRQDELICLVCNNEHLILFFQMMLSQFLF